MVYYKTIKDFYSNIPSSAVFLGIDYGQKKIGLSISDNSNKIALSYKTIYQTSSDVAKEIANIINELSINCIVIGYPLEISGNEGKACQNVLKFCDTTLKTIEIPIFLQDERFSTKIIGQALRSTKVKTKRMNTLEDSLAAASILQTTLNQINSAYGLK